MQQLFTRSFIALWALLFAGVPAIAQERILSYDSDIVISTDSSMLVTETIVVYSAGQQIQRGIYRDFPTRYRDRLNNNYQVGFELLQVLRDGRPEPARTEKRSNGLRIYIGDANVLLPTGEHRYTLQYRTNRQLGYFPDHDELYWNVTGNGWAFIIEKASARVHLPGAVNAAALDISAYTGLVGSTQRNYLTTLFDDGASVTSSTVLGPRQGLTLVLQFPKAMVTEPGQAEKLKYLLLDNLGIVLGLMAFSGSFIYLYMAWSRVGRDPRKGIIIPRYQAPPGYSPGACRYIREMGYDVQTLSAAIIGLAVKGYLTIDHSDTSYTLRAATSTEPLAAGEQVLQRALLQNGRALVLDKQFQPQLANIKSDHERALRLHYKGEYFKTNGNFLWPSLLVSLVLLLVTLLTAAAVPLAITMFVLTVLLHLCFWHWMQAPSRKGRLLLDKLEGFKQFLEVSEKDELNLRHPPEKTPELFEAFLPYAMALGVEQEWAERFTRLFEQRQRTGQPYHPLWYVGAFNASQPASFSQSVASGFSSAIAASSTPPGSNSGGGGGGFSGGGGGGGGGGGW